MSTRTRGHQEVLQTFLLWAILLGLEKKYWNGEAISRIPSMLGTLLHAHFVHKNGEDSSLQPCVVINDQFDFLDSIPIILESDSNTHIERIRVMYPIKPPTCETCGKFGHWNVECVKESCMSTDDTIHGDTKDTPPPPLSIGCRR